MNFGASGVDVKKIESYWTTVTPAGEIKNLNAVDIPEIDATDVWDLTRAEMEGRQRAIWALHALRSYEPGFENATLRTFGSCVGVREIRKIIGEYNITEHDVRNEARFDDSIGVFPEFLDAYGIAEPRVVLQSRLSPCGAITRPLGNRARRG